METRSGALHYPKRGYESFVCGLVHKHGVQYGYGNQKLEEAPRNTKARRLSDTVTSIGGLREGQGLIVEDSEPKYFVDPPRLKLLFDMARKDISTGVLVSENMAAFQEVLWNTTREFADDAAYKDKMTKLLTPLFNAIMCRRNFNFKPISSLSGLDEGNPDRASYNFRHVALTYQLYVEDDSIVDEDEVDRSRRIKLVTKLLAKIVEESVSSYKGTISNVPIQQWLQKIETGNQDAMLKFCTQWARTLQDVQHRNTGSCHPFRLGMNSPADIQASCDLLERAVELDPELVEGTAQIFELGVLFNRAEAEAREVELKTISKKPPAKLPSLTDFTDSDDNIDDEDDIFER